MILHYEKGEKPAIPWESNLRYRQNSWLPAQLSTAPTPLSFGFLFFRRCLVDVLQSQFALSTMINIAKLWMCLYRQYFGERHGVVWESNCENPYSGRGPLRVVRRNYRHLRAMISSDRVEMPDEQDLDLEPVSQANDPSSGSSRIRWLLLIVEPCSVTKNKRTA